MKDGLDGPAAPARRLLVSGASGFIGRNLVRAALQRGFAVRALVRDPGRCGGLEGAELFRGDLLDPASLRGVEEGVDAVVHGAGMLGKWRTAERELHAVNVEGTLNLLRRLAGRRSCRFIHLSAGGVSGPVREKSADETRPCRPRTPYERTKWLAEQKVLEVARALGIDAVVLRPTFTYGPGDPHKAPLFRSVQRGRFAFIGRGDSVIHPVYVDDLVNGILLAIDRARAGETYIIGGERPVSKRELVNSIADALDVRRPGAAIPQWLAWPLAALLEVAGRAFGFEPILTRSRVMMMACNFGYSIDKARRELGYLPATDLRQGIALTVRAYAQEGVIGSVHCRPA